MRRLLGWLIAMLGLTACVVVERETPTSGPPGGAAPGEPPPLASPAPLEPASDRRLIGSLGWALLSADVPGVVVEVDQLAGASLSDEAVGALEGALREHGRKQRVSVVRSDEPPPTGELSTLEDLVETSRAHRDESSGGETVALHLLVLPGRSQLGGAPGVAFQATTLAVFPDAVRQGLPPLAEVPAFESAIAVHELGHTFGLVNGTGVGAFHEDPEHPRHSEHTDSVMYWAIESPSLHEVFRSGPPREFDEADRREMERIRQQRP